MIKGKLIRGLLTDMGFQQGTEFNGEVWTNCNHGAFAQVWVYLDGWAGCRENRWDAREGLDLAKFVTWWDEQTTEGYRDQEAEIYLGDE